MKQHKVDWLEVERNPEGVAVGLGEGDRWHSRTFASYGEAEEFMMQLQRKHPVPIEYSEVEAGA
jgi:hypothetical protein